MHVHRPPKYRRSLENVIAKGQTPFSSTVESVGLGICAAETLLPRERTLQAPALSLKPLGHCPLKPCVLISSLLSLVFALKTYTQPHWTGEEVEEPW